MAGVLKSLGAFINAGVRPRTPLARGIVTILVVKVCAILLIKFTFFGPGHQVEVTDSSVDRALFGTADQPKKASKYND
jgi:hypothetical protein